MVSRTAVRRSVPAGELPDFTPVPRRTARHDGWTPERQRAFIAALADTGCVAIAARMVNMSQASAYQLRRQPGAESFRRAWDAAQTLGLQPVKDEAFDRAMNGQLVPVFVGGRLMGFRRKKNDRLLMFILRHYGQDAQGRKTTINYFSTRASAGASLPPPAGDRGRFRVRPGDGPAAAMVGERGSPEPRAAADPSALALAAAEASTTTVRTVIGGGEAPRSQLAADEAAANVLNAFEGVDLDAEAQAEIYDALAACAERRRALADDPANDPERVFIGEKETNGYLGELESGAEGDWVEYRPEGEHYWESLGEGGQAAEIDKVLAEMAERRAAMTPEQIAAEAAEHEAERQRMRDERRQALPAPKEPDPDCLPRTGSGDPGRDWRNYAAPAAEQPEGKLPSPVRGEGEGEGLADVPISPRTGRPLKRYRKRQPKPPFTAPAPGEEEAAYQARKAQAVAEVEAERRELADAEAARRRRRKSSGDSYS